MLRVTTLIDDVWQQAGNICRCYYVNSYSARSIEKKRTKNGLVRGRSTTTATPSPPPTPPTTPTRPTSPPRPPPASSSPASRSLHATTWLTAAAGLCDTHHTKVFQFRINSLYFVCVSKKYYLIVPIECLFWCQGTLQKVLTKVFISFFFFLVELGDKELFGHHRIVP